MARCPPQGSSQHKNGRTWVDKNHELKRELIKNNGGTMPYTPAFTTAPHPLSDLWSEEYLPPILFYLTVPKKLQADDKNKVGYVLDEDGKPKYRPGDSKRKVRDFTSILPDRIALDVPGWMIEAWKRYDPRIQYHDILDRMTTDLGEAQNLTNIKAVTPSPNSLSNHANRNCRLLLHHFSSWGRRDEPHHTEITAIELLTSNNFMDNTVLRRGPDGKLVRVKFVRAYAGSNIYVQIFNVTDKNYDHVTFDSDYFIKDLTEAPDADDDIKHALELLHILQERAVAHGLQPEEWERLPDKCKPASWRDRKGKETKKKPLKDCKICVWNDKDLTTSMFWAKYKLDNNATPVLNKASWTQEGEAIPRGPAKRGLKKATKTPKASTTDNNNSSSSSEEQSSAPTHVDETELAVVEQSPAAAPVVAAAPVPAAAAAAPAPAPAPAAFSSAVIDPQLLDDAARLEPIRLALALDDQA